MDIGVVIATYNQKEFVSEAIDSVLEQTRPPDQIAIADDGSKDGTQLVVEEYAERHPETIFPVIKKENKGISQNFNDGICALSTDAVTFLAGDDRYRANKIKKEANILSNYENVGAVYSNFAYTNIEGEVINQWACSRPPEGYVLEECLTREWPDNVLFRNPMISMKTLKQVGNFDLNLPIYEDWDFKIRVSAVTPIKYCNEILTEYRQHSGGVSKNISQETHKKTTKYIYNNNKDIISGNLTNEKIERVNNIFKSKILKHSAFASVDEDEYVRGVRQYIRSLRYDPSQVINYKSHLRFVLPNNVYSMLRQIRRPAVK